jgi:hypothetical protein
MATQPRRAASGRRSGIRYSAPTPTAAWTRVPWRRPKTTWLRSGTSAAQARAQMFHFDTVVVCRFLASAYVSDATAVSAALHATSLSKPGAADLSDTT